MLNSGNLGYDPSEPSLLTMLLIFIAMIGGAIFIFIFGCKVIYDSVKENADHPIYYEYVDLDGNVGTTDHYCSYGTHLGSQGAMICHLNDGTVIQVKQYVEKRR